MLRNSSNNNLSVPPSNGASKLNIPASPLGHATASQPPTPRGVSPGFVDVTGYDSKHASSVDYPIRRTRSASSFEGDEQVWILCKQLETKLGFLQREVMVLRQKLETFEEDLGKTRWGVKYSRRITIIANLLLGLWIFWSRFMRKVQKRKSKLLQNVIGMPQLQKADHRNTFNTFFYEAYLYSIGKSWVFFVSTMFLTSSQAWKRNLGLTISTGASVWFAFRRELLPWTHYFNLFSNMLYISAQWASGKTNYGTKTIQDYIGPCPEMETPSPSNSSDEGYSIESNFYTEELASRRRQYQRRSSSDLNSYFQPKNSRDEYPGSVVQVSHANDPNQMH